MNSILAAVATALTLTRSSTAAEPEPNRIDTLESKLVDADQRRRELIDEIKALSGLDADLTQLS
jgi:hypothetical protein